MVCYINHNINNFVSKNVIITDTAIIVMGGGDIYSYDNNNEFKSVPLTIHLMGNKVLGLTMMLVKRKDIFLAQMKCLEHWSVE